MAHIGKYSGESRDLDEKWLPLMAQVSEIVNTWSARRDLVAYVGTDGGQGVAPAFYDPNTAEIEVNSTIAFGEDTEPWAIDDFTKGSSHYDWPKAAGAVFHEAMHAKHSSWDIPAAHKELGYKTFKFAMTVLEESRIEAFGVRAMPKNAVFLRSCALEIVLSDMSNEEIKKLSGVRQAVHLAALGLARVDAGVLTKKDMKKTKKKLTEILGADLLAKLRVIWREFQTLQDDDVERMYELSREWVRLQEEKAKEEGEEMEGEAAGEFVIMIDANGNPSSMPGGEGGEPGEGEPGGEGGSEMSEAMAQAISDMLDAAAEDAAAAGLEADAQAQHEKGQAQRDEAAQKAKEEREDQETTERTAKKVFNHEVGPTGHTSSRKVADRPPTSQERSAANNIAQLMQKARYRDHLVTERMSATPPGRLNTSAAMQAKAIRQRGGQFVAEPFKQKQRHNVEDPKLTLGIMCDISGSMSATMEPMATSTWIMQEAIRRIEGMAAAVYYGDSVFPTLKPGQHMDKVTSYSARDGSEDFDTAFRALDGSLELLNGRGARLVVVCSDGQYTSHQLVACERWLKKCREMGVGIVWLGYGGSGYWGSGSDRRMTEANGGQYVEIKDGDILGAATAIGMACAKALTSASA